MYVAYLPFGGVADLRKTGKKELPSMLELVSLKNRKALLVSLIEGLDMLVMRIL